MLGIKDEKELVKLLNREPNNSIWAKLLGTLDIKLNEKDKYYAIHVTSKKSSKFHDSEISPKADLFIAYGNIDSKYLNSKDYFLSEKDSKTYKLKPVAYSGISVKKEGSRSFTICKISPDPFGRIFGNTELGSGVSVYCQKAEDLKKNIDVICGWNTTIDKFIDFYKARGINNIEKIQDSSTSNSQLLKIYGEVKSCAINEMSNIIKDDSKVKDYVFQGKGAFEEPFTAHWLYQDGVISNECYITFSITTGSGRSKGIYTVSVKPK